MSIIVNKETRLLIQGITGKEGQKALKTARAYHTQVIAGVTPKKGGQEVDGVPVYNTVKEALEAHPEINTTAVYVPPFAAKAAVLEAVNAGIPIINIMTERIPIQDSVYFLAAAREKSVQVIGPSSLGVLSTDQGRIGVIGGPNPEEIYTPGSIGVISRSGGMTNEVSWQLAQAGIGITTAVHVGGDMMMGTSYADALKLFEQDEETTGVVIFGEVGGHYEFDIVELIQSGGFTKPVAIFIGGKFAEKLPEGMTIGHAGAIIEKGKGSVRQKEQALKDAGVMVAERYEQLPELIKPYSK